MNELERRLRPVEIYLIMETFCSTNHRKSSIVVIWVEVSLSNFWKQRNWSLEHLLTRRSRSKTDGHLFIGTSSLEAVEARQSYSWDQTRWREQCYRGICRDKSVKYTEVQTSESYVLRYLHAQSFSYWISVYSVVMQVVFVSAMTDLINFIKQLTVHPVWVCVIGFKPC
jgi:hypothetical protein